MYSDTDKKECIELHYNYIPACMESNGEKTDCYPEDYKVAKVGEKGVVQICEHSAMGEGDKWFYDIVKEDNTMERIFSPYHAFYKLIQ